MLHHMAISTVMAMRLFVCSAINMCACVQGVIVHLCVLVCSIFLVFLVLEGSGASRCWQSFVCFIVMSSQSAHCPQKDTAKVSVTVV